MVGLPVAKSLGQQIRPKLAHSCHMMLIVQVLQEKKKVVVVMVTAAVVGEISIHKDMRQTFEISWEMCPGRFHGAYMDASANIARRRKSGIVPFR
jgi:hypothetical protein